LIEKVDLRGWILINLSDCMLMISLFGLMHR